MTATKGRELGRGRGSEGSGLMVSDEYEDEDEEDEDEAESSVACFWATEICGSFLEKKT